VVTAHNQTIADKLKQAGADLVLIPYEDAGKGAAAQIMEMADAGHHQLPKIEI
jgi:Trk K+ transport system NAD-binding subunit